MKRVLVIIAHEGFQDSEYLAVQDVMKKHNYKIDTASTQLSFATGMSGTKVKPDIDLEEAMLNLHNYSAIILIGGKGAKVYFKNELCLEIIKDANNSNKVIAAICTAPVILANAGVLDGVKATVYSNMLNNSYVDIIKVKGARYVSQNVVVDRNIVTASGPNTAKKFAELIIATVEKKV